MSQKKGAKGLNHHNKEIADAKKAEEVSKFSRMGHLFYRPPGGRLPWAGRRFV